MVKLGRIIPLHTLRVDHWGVEWVISQEVMGTRRRRCQGVSATAGEGEQPTAAGIERVTGEVRQACK